MFSTGADFSLPLVLILTASFVPDIPLFLRLLFGGITAGLVAFLLVFVARAARSRAGAAPQRRVRTIALGLLLWLAATGVLAARGFFDDFSGLPPRLALVVLPAFGAMLLAGMLPRVRAFVRGAPLTWLIYIQSFRVLLEILLFLLHRHGIVPEQMTFEGLNFDILTGLTAPLVGWWVSRGGRAARRGAQLWNVAGMILALTITVVSVLSTPAPFRVFVEGPANTFVATFPFVWLPAFVVPAALLFHLWSLAQLRTSEPAGTPARPAHAA